MKRILLLSFSSVALYLSLTSYSTGPSAVGHATAQTGCSGGSCHGGASSNTTATIILIEKSSGDTVKNNKYKPGVDYSAVVVGTNATAKAYGFILRSSHTSATMQAGTFGTNVMPAAYTKTQSVGGFTVFEHKARVPASMGSFQASVDWTAPANGTGDVAMHLAVNAVDSNLANSGDQWAVTSSTFAEEATSIAQISKQEVSIYPNPVANQLHINSNQQYQFTISSLNGSVELNGVGNTIDVSSLSTGIHVLRLTDGQNIQVSTFSKL